MKKLITTLACLTLIVATFTGCGKPKTINGKYYETYGLLNADMKKDPNIQYEICYGNIVWGIVLSETVIAPVYFFGFSLYNPVDIK